MNLDRAWSRAAGATLMLFALCAPARGVGLALAQPAQRVSGGRVEPRVLDAVVRDGSERVLIIFDPALTPPTGGVSPLGGSRASAIASTGAALLGDLSGSGFELRHRYRSVNALAGRVDAAALARLRTNPAVLHVALDEGGSGQLAEAVPAAGLGPDLGVALTGAGVTLAVIDSGVESSHPDLSRDIVGERCFCSAGGLGCCPDGSVSQVGSGSAEDDHGHGTNVAGIVTSDGGIAPLGAAPDAGVVAIKVLDQNNEFCCVSDLLAALDYVLNQRQDVDVINLSLGTFTLYDGACDDQPLPSIFAVLTRQLVESGRTIFAASMNDGSGTQMGLPACLSDVISVGATYDSALGPQFGFGCIDPAADVDQVACWSNSNLATDLVAPGAPISSTGRFGGVSSFRGTSQASPLAAACAALLLEADPGLTPAEIRTALTSVTTQATDAKNGLTFPRLNCVEALLSLGLPECSDGVDNDGDGFTDFPADIGCGSAVSGNEAPACSDGVDNDGDGRIDFDGGAFANGGIPIADPDPSCADQPTRNGEVRKRCGLGPELLALAMLLATRRRRSLLRSRTSAPGRQ